MTILLELAKQLVQFGKLAAVRDELPHAWNFNVGETLLALGWSRKHIEDWVVHWIHLCIHDRLLSLLRNAIERRLYKVVEESGLLLCDASLT